MKLLKETPRLATLLVVVGAILGLVFASISTSDFAMHLDRQTHDVHCSFMPGAPPVAGESACQVTMISPYSSIWRGAVWGGVPIALPAVGVFAFLLYLALDLWLSGRQRESRPTGFLALAALVPAVTSAVMAYIAITKLDAACKLCIGIYVASALTLVGAALLWLGRGSDADAPSPNEADAEPPAPPRGLAWIAVMAGLGALFVALPVGAYVADAPDHAEAVASCGVLAHPEDKFGIMLPMEPNPGKTPALEVLDPLCPACRAFEESLRASGLDKQMDRKAVLFPLDETCNWMLDKSLHPGACAISEAMLCAGDKAPEVLAWAFQSQDEIRDAAQKDPSAAARLVTKRFPSLARCVGSPEIRMKLNRSLRWAVENQLPVLTPQLFVDGKKLCDEDVDLGLEFALPRLLEGGSRGPRAALTLDEKETTR